MSFLYFKLVHLPLFVAVYWKHDCVTCVCVSQRGDLFSRTIDVTAIRKLKAKCSIYVETVVTTF